MKNAVLLKKFENLNNLDFEDVVNVVGDNKKIMSLLRDRGYEYIDVKDILRIPYIHVNDGNLNFSLNSFIKFSDDYGIFGDFLIHLSLFNTNYARDNIKTPVDVYIYEDNEAFKGDNYYLGLFSYDNDESPAFEEITEFANFKLINSDFEIKNLKYKECIFPVIRCKEANYKERSVLVFNVESEENKNINKTEDWIKPNSTNLINW